MSETCGPNASEPFAILDPAMPVSRTSPDSSPATSPRTWVDGAQLGLLASSDEFCATWPKSGTMRNGRCYRQPSAVRPTVASASGSWRIHNWPSPTCADDRTGNLASTQIVEGSQHSVTLPRAAEGWATPNCPRDHDSDNSAGMGMQRQEDTGKKARWFDGTLSQTGPTPSPTAGPMAPCDSSPVEPSNWATPAADDAVGSHGGGQGKSLRTDTANFRGGKPKGRGLNPRFGLWLMGYWPDYFDGVEIPKKGRKK